MPGTRGELARNATVSRLVVRSRCYACFASDCRCSAVVDVDGNPIFPSGVILLYNKKDRIGLDPSAWERLLRSSIDVCVGESTFRQAEVVSEQRGCHSVRQPEGKLTRSTYQSLDLLSLRKAQTSQ